MNDMRALLGKDADTRLILTSHSIDNTFDSCARKFEFLALYDKRPERESGYAADVGTALHEATQAWLIKRAEDYSEAEATEHGFYTLMKWFPWDREREQPTGLRSFPMVCAMFYAIIRHPEWDDWELVRVKDHGWAVEVPFLVIHESLGDVMLKNAGVAAKLATQGKIDFILRHRRTGQYRTLDLKTTMLSPDLERAEYTYSGQQIGYSNVMHAMVGVEPDQFTVSYIVAHFSMTEMPQVNFLELEKAPDLIDDYWMSKMDRLHRMKAYAEAGWFPRTNGSCHGWGKECTFFDICRSRDYDLINHWFDGINAVPQKGYDYWVTLRV